MSANPWFRASFDLFSLGLEASSVIALRTMKLATGDAAAGKEAERMLREKVEAAFDLQALFLTGRLGTSAPAAVNKTLAHYRRKVRANQKRLNK